MANDYRDIQEDKYNADEVYDDLKKSIRGQWQTGPRPYGQRYPEGASAQESNRGQTVSSQIALARKRQQKLEHIYGTKIPEKGVDKSALLQNTLVEMLKVQRKLLRLMDDQVPIGQVDGYNFPLSASAPLMHIDFVEATEGEKSTNIPAGINLSVPGRLLYGLHVYNDGVGTLAISTNLSESRYEATVTLNPGESLKFEYKWPIIKTLNLKCTSGTANVRLIAIY